MYLGGSGKAEGFADGEWTNHRQAGACRCHPAAIPSPAHGALGFMSTADENS